MSSELPVCTTSVAINPICTLHYPTTCKKLAITSLQCLLTFPHVTMGTESEYCVLPLLSSLKSYRTPWVADSNCQLWCRSLRLSPMYVNIHEIPSPTTLLCRLLNTWQDDNRSKNRLGPSVSTCPDLFHVQPPFGYTPFLRPCHMIRLDAKTWGSSISTANQKYILKITND